MYFVREAKVPRKVDFRAIFSRAGVPPAIEQFNPAGGSPALRDLEKSQADGF
jgi:hypothetical protein